MTQPAFSRRIQALEAWAGAELVDRSAHPTRLTPAGEALYAQALDVLQSLRATRTQLRGLGEAAEGLVEIAVPHAVASHGFPAWFAAARQSRDRMGESQPMPWRCRLVTLNVQDAAMRLMEGACDLLLAYQSPLLPLPLEASRYDMLELGEDTLWPYARCDAQGQAMHRLPGRVHGPVPWLAYGSGAYLGRVVDAWMKQQGCDWHLDRICETDMADALKAMALAGHGVAFLPGAVAAAELASGQLALAAPPGALEAGPTLALRAYRERPSVRVPRPAADRWWAFLAAGRLGGGAKIRA